MSLTSGSCFECTSRGSRCSLFVPEKQWNDHEESRDKLLVQRNEVRRKIDELRKAERDARATEDRLDTQLRFLERRERDYFACDGASLEEMRRLELAEAKAKGLPLPEPPGVEDPPPLDPLTTNWSLLDPYKIHPLNPAAWPPPAVAAPFDFAVVDQPSEGSAGGTIPVSSGSSSGT